MRFLVPVAVGAVLGALLGRFGACADGACPLLATPWRGALYGAALGLLLALTDRTH